MNTTRFTLNFNELVKLLNQANFPKSELANLAMQAALKLEELELQERQIALAEEKTRQELELAIINAKNVNQHTLAETLKSVIQADSMARSVKDNAAINKANAHIGFINVVGNAQERGAISNHSNKVVSTIDLIDTSDLNPKYKQLLDTIRDDIENALNKGDGCKEVAVFIPRLEVLVNERIRVLGFSSYGNNATKFSINGQETQGDDKKTLLFTASKVGKYTITFSAQNDAGQWVSDSAIIEVRDIR